MNPNDLIRRGDVCKKMHGIVVWSPFTVGSVETKVWVQGAIDLIEKLETEIAALPAVTDPQISTLIVEREIDARYIEQLRDELSVAKATNARLVEALRGMTQFFAMPNENSIDRFDRLAEQYRRETGKWAPGKSIPDAYNDSTDDETRRADYDAWVQLKVVTARALLAELEAKA